jgi:plasmid stabilization system protein ParE
MAKLRVSRRAISDISSIAAYISKDRPSAALRVGAKLYQTFEFLARHPAAGMARDDVRKGVRLYTPASPAHRYVVFFEYRAADDVVEIAAVIDGARDWARIFQDPGA